MTENTDAVGTLTVDVTIADHFRPEHTRTVREVMLDTGSDATWISAGSLEELGIRRIKRDIIEYANGLQAIRSIGYAIVRVDNERPPTKSCSPSPEITCCSARVPSRGSGSWWTRAASDSSTEGRSWRWVPRAWPSAAQPTSSTHQDLRFHPTRASDPGPVAMPLLVNPRRVEIAASPPSSGARPSVRNRS